ncbi:hypothetical protein AAFF_G00256150 [Aldrovandia affinis]|uniref:Uncharacterized protein n=1 Tax=Aldrovandia affinis TaxID=143900 RepID=A0AAD7RC44_9TELE|nr:hypothetical protein AAFF_G00256150 [Aldrovandia affinis]
MSSCSGSMRSPTACTTPSPGKSGDTGPRFSPRLGPTCGPDSEHTAAIEDPVGEKASHMEGMIFRNPEMCNLLLSEENSLDHNHLRSKLEVDIMLHLQQNHYKNPTRTRSKDCVVSSSPQSTEQPEGGAGEASDSLGAPLPAQADTTRHGSGSTCLPPENLKA